MLNNLNNNVKEWIERKTAEYVERDVKEWRDILAAEWASNAPSDATQEDFEGFCEELEGAEQAYREEREEYWREELYKLCVDLGGKGE